MRALAATATSSTRLVRAAVDAFNADPMAVLRFLDPSVEFEVSGRRCHGHAGVRAALAPTIAAFEEIHAEAVDVVDLGPGVFMATIRHRGRGGRSHAACASELFHVFRMRDGRVGWWAIYIDESAAIAAASESNGKPRVLLHGAQ